jgi:thiol-disulfide isomerase/thioredoxin
MPRKRQTKVGKLNPIDVRSKSEIGALESLLGKGPLTIVLVYADWCGHCQTFKQNMWNEVSQMPNKKVNTAAVHYDMVENTSLKNAKIDGYPSLLLVGTDKQPATFKEEGKTTNAMPAPESVEQLKSMVNTPVNSPVSNANTVVSSLIKNANVNNSNTVNNNSNTINVSANTSNANLVRNNTVKNNVVTNRKNNIFTNRNTVNSYEPAQANTLQVPDVYSDIRNNATVLPSLETNAKKQQGGFVGPIHPTSQRGGNGSLFSALTRITMEAGHAGALLLAATEYADLGKRVTRKLKKRSKKSSTGKRKQRK